MIENYFYPEASPKADEVTEINPVESIDLRPLDTVTASKEKDVKGLRQSLLIKNYDILCESRPLNVSIVNVLKNLVNANSEEELDKDADVEYLSEIKADIKRNPIIKRLKYTGRNQATSTIITLISNYCGEKGMVYTQGMLDIIIPFVLLESSYFKIEEVYAILKKFLGDFVLNSLQSMHNGEEKCLPFLMG